MREIKFRAWLPEQKLMGLVTEMSLRNDKYIPTSIQVEYYYEIDNPLGNMNRKQQQFTTSTDFNLMQFTGLKDKNGKDIYEGDIVRYKDNEDGKWHKGKVIYGSNNCAWNFERLNKGKTTDGKNWSQTIRIPMLNFMYGLKMLVPDIDFKVIGNIYENPELLTNNNGGIEK